MRIEISPATIADIPTIQQVGEQTFREAYENMTTEAYIQEYCSKAFDEKLLAEELVSKQIHYFLAKQASETIGYLKLRSDLTDHAIAHENAIKIERIYLIKSYWHRGLGDVLMQFCLDFATKQGFSLIWLLVWQRNKSAVRFYEKWQFAVFGDRYFDAADQAAGLPPDDWVMKKSLL